RDDGLAVAAPGPGWAGPPSATWARSIRPPVGEAEAAAGSAEGQADRRGVTGCVPLATHPAMAVSAVRVAIGPLHSMRGLLVKNVKQIIEILGGFERLKQEPIQLPVEEFMPLN